MCSLSRLVAVCRPIQHFLPTFLFFCVVQSGNADVPEGDGPPEYTVTGSEGSQTEAGAPPTSDPQPAQGEVAGASGQDDSDIIDIGASGCSWVLSSSVCFWHEHCMQAFRGASYNAADF